jgi:hypothetical protein
MSLVVCTSLLKSEVFVRAERALLSRRVSAECLGLSLPPSSEGTVCFAMQRLHLLHLMGEDHEEAHASYACWLLFSVGRRPCMLVMHCSAFDVNAPCLTCVGEFAFDYIKEDGSAGLSQEDSGKNGEPRSTWLSRGTVLPSW